MWRKVRFTRCIVLLVILLTCCCPGNSLLGETPFPFPATVFTESDFTETDFLSIDDEMKEFLAAHVPKTAASKARLQLLIDAIFDRSRLGFAYAGRTTLTPPQTFRKRAGNCLSYTAMFIVMARHVGLTSYFQEVYDFSNYSKEDNIVLFNRHINAIVLIDGKQFEVDFSFSTDKSLRRCRIVSDKKATAHFFNNIGVEALMKKDYSMAESNFLTAIRLAPCFTPAHSNLGLLYQLTDRPRKAESSFLLALKIDKHDVSAHTNLARLYDGLGKPEKAKKILSHINKSLLKNPFYLYGLGLNALKEENHVAAVKYFKKAIKRAPTEPEFYFKAAVAFFKQGNLSSALKYLKKAEQKALSPRDRLRYNQKLEYLYSQNKSD